MDPPVMANGGAFRSANPASFNLSEMWPFPTNLGGAAAASYHLGQVAESNYANRGVSVVVDDDLVLDQRGGHNGGGAKKRREEDELANDGSPIKGMNDFDRKRIKTVAPEDENQEAKVEPEEKSGKLASTNAKPVEPPKQDYIHVRARRGQATDSHSLAERARREKISERMKILQDLVPGCNKVIGKALVLDEIINYIQSLQHQVEFLSMKLEAVTSRPNPTAEGFPSKDYGQQAYDMTGPQFSSQAARECLRSSSPEWLHMQIGSGFERT